MSPWRAKKRIDCSVYLVTDSTPAVLGTRDLLSVVEEALRGGVTAVQLRDKKGQHEQMVATARALHALTSKFDVPLLINDNVDVAVEVDCEGLHIGQDDMKLALARKMLGAGKIIGVSASTAAEAIAACRDGADYLGLGTVYATPTKKDTKSIIGPRGVHDILAALAAAGFGSTPTVCIGGISTANAAAVLQQAQSPSKGLSGVAVVSAIMSAPDATAAASSLVSTVLKSLMPRVVKQISETKPLSHNMTNLVVQNFAANVALAVGASPIMSNLADEAPDLVGLDGALVVNMGTITPDGLQNLVRAVETYNRAGRPIVLDPVGVGATAVRREAVKQLLTQGHFEVIKGNASELLAVAGAIMVQRGVDSTATMSVAHRAKLARDLARKQSCVVVLSGATDIVSDGRRTLRIDNGHELLGCITGSGCTLGTALSAALAVSPHDHLTAAVAATVMFGIAAEKAAQDGKVGGPGTFVPVFIDQLYRIRKATEEHDFGWVASAKVDVVDVDDCNCPDV
ncbi:hypothetical protein CDD82_4920 [Ophiocordyceps australis]|uniref:Thiamine phosphate synthase/TenI domain-containing protein n=1 Tax=Ophiocordyceps australis TaxID=1399860 RepID=A0A2C5ZL90_9HYPO|nr:hypothetical protein CDD82_4920 [Ophiocordyceps australis]